MNDHQMNPEYLPRGIMKGKESRDGGDSLFEIALKRLRDLVKDGFKMDLPVVVNKLGQLITKKVHKFPERLGMTKVRIHKRMLTAISV